MGTILGYIRDGTSDSFTTSDMYFPTLEKSECLRILKYYWLLCEILSFDHGEYEDYCSLGCDAM
jgi:hypothetical protein